MSYLGVYECCNQNKTLLANTYGHPLPKSEVIAAVLYNLSGAIANLAQAIEDGLAGRRVAAKTAAQPRQPQRSRPRRSKAKR